MAGVPPGGGGAPAPANPERTKSNPPAWAKYQEALVAVRNKNSAVLDQLFPDGLEHHNCDFAVWPRQKKLIHWCCQYDFVEGVQFFLDKGVDVFCVDSKGNQPVHTAAYYGAVDVLKHLVETGADPLARNALDETAKGAASNGNAPRCQDCVIYLEQL
mmetsp:Transcript_21303/g.63486  ORF Transcript_21303/g.63486 Transcript_21303/m.63486 type:complete len:158 (+) Transcript_21303:200-673(+)